MQESGRVYDTGKDQEGLPFGEESPLCQKRFSGEPYIHHPLQVACILTELGMDTDCICAALLHDVVEDTSVTLEQLKSGFGDEVASLVDGVTKLGKVPLSTKEQQQSENVRKMLLAMNQDIRVVIIKLADRLHNMRTLRTCVRINSGKSRWK